MFNLLIMFLVILLVLVGVAAWKPELVKRAAGWLIVAGAAVAGWLNMDAIKGLF